MDIGTAKPDARDAAGGAAPPRSTSSSRTRRIPRRASATTRSPPCARSPSASSIPLLVGGTMLYFKALLEGLNELPEADPMIRLVIDTMAQEEGWPAVHAKLKEVDPADRGAARAQRRAAHAARARDLLHHRQDDGASSCRSRATSTFPTRAIKIALVPGDRAVLHERIEQRFDADARARARATRSSSCARNTVSTRRCRRCAASATGRRGSISNGELGLRGAAQPRRRRDAPARQAPAHVAALDGGRDAVRLPGEDVGARVLEYVRRELEALRCRVAAHSPSAADDDGPSTRRILSQRSSFLTSVCAEPRANVTSSASPGASCAASRTTAPEASSAMRSRARARARD